MNGRIGGNDDYGTKHIFLDESMGVPDPKPEDEARVEQLWVLVAVHDNEGEGIFGETVEGPLGIPMLIQFISSFESMKERFDEKLRQDGTAEVAKRDGVRLEWRRFSATGEVEPLA